MVMGTRRDARDEAAAGQIKSVVDISSKRFLIVALASSSCWGAVHAWADALVVTKAMSASTIAEIFVEEKIVRVSLEIGTSDLLAFREILPDEVLEKLAPNSVKAAERRLAFFQRVFVIRADDGVPLPGRVETLQARRRVVRDEITGEPVPEQPDDAELVVAAELRYDMGETPATLSIRPPEGKGSDRLANIGFVAYHRGLPINDFRYLSGEETLDLNWDDPWYSRFPQSKSMAPKCCSRVRLSLCRAV